MRSLSVYSGFITAVPIGPFIYYAVKDRIRSKFSSLRDQWNNRKLYHYYRCPQCRQKLRVPRGRGRIQISCPRCGTQFIKKS